MDIQTADIYFRNYAQRRAVEGNLGMAKMAGVASWIMKALACMKQIKDPENSDWVDAYKKGVIRALTTASGLLAEAIQVIGDENDR